jgi:hypothetical protein
MGFCADFWDSEQVCFKRNFRWQLIIPDVSADGIWSLPPLKSARPSLTFKEMSVEHLNETIYRPSKPDWKPLTLTLYDLVRPIENPIFTWIRRQYDPANCAYWRPCLMNPTFVAAYIQLHMYDGCGNIVETWVYEHVYIMSAEFGNLDMSDNDVTKVECQLRYDRAYTTLPDSVFQPNLPDVIPSYTCDSIIPSFTPPSFINFIDMLEYEQMEPEFIQIKWNGSKS